MATDGGSDSRRRILVGGVAASLVVLLGGVALWYFVLRDDAPPPASTEAAVESARENTDASTSSTTDGDDPVSGLDGVWAVDTTIGSFDDFTNSWIGYRIDEEVTPVGANTAAGRTPGVSGELMLDGTELVVVSVEADMTSLVSDDDRRDGQLTGRGLQTDTFPTATFSLTEPVDLGEIPVDGETITVAATGELELHGVTQPVIVDLEATLVNDVITVVGSTEVVLADYAIEPPVGFAVLSVADAGLLEFQLFFTKA